MIRRIALMVALFIPTFHAFADDDATAELRKASQTFFVAVLKVDKESLDRFLSPDYLIVDNVSKQTKTTKKEWLESLDKAKRDRQNNPESWSQPQTKFKEVNFRLFADTGVETGLVFSKSQRTEEIQKQTKTEVSISAMRYTNVWVRQQGQWLLVSSHSSISEDESTAEDWNK